MLDKICWVVYKGVNLIVWISAILVCIIFVMIVVSMPYLTCRYIFGFSLKHSITVGVEFWMFMGLAYIVGVAYAKGRDLTQNLNEETKNDNRRN